MNIFTRLPLVSALVLFITHPVHALSVGDTVDIGEVPCMGLMTSYWAQSDAEYNSGAVQFQKPKVSAVNGNEIKYLLCKSEKPTHCSTIIANDNTVRYATDDVTFKKETCEFADANITKFCTEPDFANSEISLERFQEHCTSISARYNKEAKSCTCPIDKDEKVDANGRTHNAQTISYSQYDSKAILFFSCVIQSPVDRFIKNNKLNYTYGKLMNLCHAANSNAKSAASPASTKRRARPQALENKK